MNKKIIAEKLIQIANQLDQDGLYKEANEITKMTVKLAKGYVGKGLHESWLSPEYNSQAAPLETNTEDDYNNLSDEDAFSDYTDEELQSMIAAFQHELIRRKTV